MDNIKIIDVFGSSDSKGAEHHYSYFAPQYSKYSGWSKYVSDLREEIVSGMQECYCCFCTNEGWWISKIIRNPHDLREDPIMVSVCIGENRPKSGKKAVELLDGFVDFFVIQKNWDDEETKKKLLCVDQDFELIPCALVESALPTLNHKSAYRTYGSIEELSECISFLPQQGYEKYSRVFFVPKENSSGMPIECIDETLPMKKIYLIEYPDGCSSPSGKTEIMEGESLDLVYTKQGLEPYGTSIKVGEPTDFAYVDGDTLHIKSGKDLGLVHNRVITIKCQDKDGNVIEGFKLEKYTKQHSDVMIKGKQIVLPENFSEFVVVEVKPDEDKYETEKVNVGSGEKENPKVLVLKPKDYKVIFRMGTEDFETTKTMNPSVAKTRWSGFESEVDNNKKIIYFRAYGKPSEKHHETIHTKVENPPLFERFPWLAYVIAGLLALLLGYGIYAGVSRWGFHKTPWPFKEEIEVKDNKDNAEEIQESIQPKQEVVEPVDAETAMKEHDLDYLTAEKKLWVRDSIQSKEIQTLYDDISQGEVENVISQYDGLFSGSDNANETFKLIVEGLKKLVQTGGQFQKQAADEMKRLSKGNSIKLEELLTSINLIVKRSQSGVNQSQPASVSGSSSSSNQKKPNSDEG